MRKIMFLACMAAGLLTACEKVPDMDSLDADLTVYTDHAADTDFGSFATYYLPDSILEAGNTHVSYWTDQNAMTILDEVETRMNSLGYTRISDPAQKDNADVGVQLSYVAQTNFVITGDYWNGWWDPFYWGWGWGGWYYPYPVTYAYDTQTLVMEMVDLTQRGTAEHPSKIPVVWYPSMSGYLYANNRVNRQLLHEGIGQAFDQSPYLTTDKQTE